MRQGGPIRRRVGIVVIACVAFLGTAVPVLADPSDPPPEPSAGGEPLGGPLLKASEYGVPTSAEIAAMHQDVVRAEEERARELEEEPFVAQRESSRHAYEEETPSESEELLRSTFGEALQELNGEPGRALTDAKLDESLGEGAAVVTVDGRNEILQADQPIETENDEGEMEKVDLSLEPGPEGFEPENPLVETVIGTTAEEGVEIGEEGMTVTQVGAEESKGRLLGDKNVFFGEVEAGSDTDLMVSPTSRGVELFDMLRSVESPETISFHLDVPEGDTLRPEPGGGAEVVDGEGHVVALIDKPHGEDAQGTYVPVELEVEGDSVVLVTHHRSENLAYPILIDPEIENGQSDVGQGWGWWFAGANLQGLGYWHFEAVGSAVEGRTSDPAYPGQPGLYTAFPVWPSSPGWRGTWYLNTRNTGVYLRNLEINPFNRNDETANCPDTLEPYDYEGYRDVVRHEWVGNYGLPWYNDAHNQGWFHREGWGHQFDFGLEVDGEPEINCWRSLRAGGVAFWMGDWGPPTMESATYSGPSGWIKSTGTFSVTARASDGGLGVKEFDFTSGGVFPVQRRGAVGEKSAECTGTYENPCWERAWDTYTFSGAGFSPGESQVQVSALDATLHGSNTKTFPLKVDPSPPSVKLKGQFEAAIVEGQAEPGEGQKPNEHGPQLSQPVYNLKVEATDGSTAEAATKQSGVQKIEVLVDKEARPPLTNASCPNSSCPLSGTVSIPLTGLSAGPHHLTVKAYDFAGNEADVIEQSFEYFPATGLTEEDVTQRFLLPDGKNHEGSSYAGPELAVNVMNGNVVYHQRDVDVEGPNVDLEAELFYNSQLPKEESSEFGRGWTLSQTPALKSSGSGGQATALMSTSALAGGVDLPQGSGQGYFSDKLNAYIEKMPGPGGGYAVSPDGGEETPATIYDAAGKVTEVQTSPTASVQYAYAGGHLSEIAVDDPGSTTLAPPPVKKARVVPNYVSSFGSAGAGTGQLSHPADVALDSKGNEWVADSGNNRIEEFTPAGEFIKVFAPGGGVTFSTPKSLAFDAAGDLWVDDSGNSRLLEFSASGTLMKTVGTNGPGTNQFNRPEGIAIAPNGHIWVADTYNYRVVELGAAGEWMKVVNPSGLGEIEPTGVDVGPEGKVWVADWAHNRIVEFGAGGELIRQVGSMGTTEGKFRQPDAIAVGALGEVWVGDQNNERVQEFTKEGAYVTQFGSAGSGPGQFSFSYPLGIATDNEGSLFVTDTNDNRVEHWQIPHYGNKPVFSASFGSAGTGPGQYRHPGGLAVNDEGYVWIPDTENNRIQELGPNGEFKRQIGTSGSGAGQFNRPKSIAFDDEGDFWVADSGNNRLEEFRRSGEFVKSVVSLGPGNAELNGPEGIAIAPNGHIWVADTYNYRIVELDENGNFIKVVNPSGLGHIEPTGIALGPGGNAWIADWMGDRVVEISPAGELIRQFGTAGTGNGQFERPDTVAVAPHGSIYVVDQNNARVQVFNQEGVYLSQFGSPGAGAGQFSFAYPTGIAADGRGDIWVSDYNNHIQRWLTGYATYAEEEKEEEEHPVQDDPVVAVKSAAGQITALEGTQAGVHNYVHENGLLTKDEGPGGTTSYEYEPTTQMLKKITLPNGTSASIAYDTTGRATEVTVTPVGSGPKTTKFTYTQETGIEEKEGKRTTVTGENRRTTVEVVGGKRTFYLFDNAGDMIKSWNTLTAPVFKQGTGSIIEKAEKPNDPEKELTKGDQNVFIEGKSIEGIKTIQLIVNGTTIVDEKTCPGATREACEEERMNWIVNTLELPPGTMWVEAVLTNFEGITASKRWWVTVPYLPPPNDGEPEPPTYKEVLNFREEYGLDIGLNPVVDEKELQLRVQVPIGAWYNPETKLGEYARASWERWGVPLGKPDIDQLEYRESYVAQDGPLIEAWGEEHAVGTYGGFWVNNRAGGIIEVGFTANGASELSQLKSEVPLMAADRIAAVPAAVSRASLQASLAQITSSWLSNAELSNNLTEMYLDTRRNTLVVGARNVGSAREVLVNMVGASTPLEVHASNGDGEFDGRYETRGKMEAGDAILTEEPNHECTAGPGAWKSNGPNQPKTKFLLTAGHCGVVGQTEFRMAGRETTKGAVAIGTVVATGLPRTGGYEEDGDLIALNNGNIAPSQIFRPGVAPLRPGRSAATIKEDDTLCFSGVRTGMIKCGPVLRFFEFHPTVDPREPSGPIGLLGSVEMGGNFKTMGGDSGGPVWDAQTKDIVGLVSGSRANGNSVVAPLLPLPDPKIVAPGILSDLGAGLQIETGE